MRSQTTLKEIASNPFEARQAQDCASNRRFYPNDQNLIDEFYRLYGRTIDEYQTQPWTTTTTSDIWTTDGSINPPMYYRSTGGTTSSIMIGNPYTTTGVESSIILNTASYYTVPAEAVWGTNTFTTATIAGDSWDATLTDERSSDIDE